MDAERHAVDIPGHVLTKVVNSHRRLHRLRQIGIPEEFVNRELEIRDRALDGFCAWAEEHAPQLFYTEKADD